MQDFHKDSTICFNQEELRVISLKLIDANECNLLLKVSNKLNEFKDSTIAAQDTIITKQEIQVALLDTIVNKQSIVIEDLNKKVSVSENKIKWIKIGWAATSAILFSTLIYVIAHQ